MRTKIFERRKYKDDHTNPKGIERERLRDARRRAGGGGCRTPVWLFRTVGMREGNKKKRQVRTLAIDIRLDIPTSQT